MSEHRTQIFRVRLVDRYSARHSLVVVVAITTVGGVSDHPLAVGYRTIQQAAESSDTRRGKRMISVYHIYMYIYIYIL